MPPSPNGSSETAAASGNSAAFPFFTEQMPIAAALYRGRELRFERVNERMLAAIGRSADEVLGRTFSEALPELADQSFVEQMQQVFDTGKPFIASETPVALRNARDEAETRIFNYSYTAVRDEATGPVVGILALASDVTEVVEARSVLEEKEKQLRLALEGSELGTFDYLLPENRLIWSAKTYELFGMEPGSGQVNYDLFLRGLHPEDREEIDAAVKQALQPDCGVYDVEYRTVGIEDGKVRWIRAAGKVSFDTAGQPQRFTGTVQEIMPLKSAARLALLKDRAVAASADGIVITGAAKPDSPIVYVNAAFERMTGYSAADILGRDCRFLQNDDHDQADLPRLRAALNAGKPCTVVLRNYRKDGTLFYNELTVSPVTDGGKLVHFVGIQKDVTSRLETEQALRHSKAELEFAVNAAELGTWELNPKTMRFSANARLKEWLGLPAATDFPLQLVTDAIVADDRERVQKALLAALEPGAAPFDEEYAMVHPQTGVSRIVRAKGRSALDEETGAVVGFNGTLRDITAEATARQRLEVSEANFRQLADAVPQMVWVTRPDGFHEYYNRRWYEYTGVSEGTTDGAGWNDLFHPDDRERAWEVWQESLATGTPYRIEYRLRHHSGMYRWVLGRALAIRNDAGDIVKWYGTCTDIHEQVAAAAALRESEEKFRSVIASAPAAIALFTGRELIVESPNQAFIDIVGKDWSIMGKPLRDAVPELVTENQPFLKILDDVFTTGVSFHTQESQVKIVRNGVLTANYYNFTYTPLLNAEGTVYAILEIAIDVTEQVEARRKLEETEAALRGAIDLAELATWSLDVNTGLYSGSQRFLDWLGVASSEAIPTHADLRFIPESHRLDVQARVAKALAGGGAEGYEAEHPVVNLHTGQVRIVHAQGHVAADAEGRPQTLSGTAQDVTKQRALQGELERQVRERTEELQATNEEMVELNDRLLQSNAELEQYAYVASHDLQEPLRKIRMFSGILGSQKGLSDDAKPVIGKIAAAAERMSQLIQSLLEFSRLLKSDALIRPVALDDVVRDVIKDFELLVAEKQAVIEMGTLPVVEGVGLQMNQLFYNLISNALKFSKPGVAPHITLAAAPASPDLVSAHVAGADAAGAYYHVTVQDNGIGFDTQYAEQIFEVFKRLHTRDAYPGSGIGLALCRKIADNHGGALWAASKPNVGTTFHILLPARQTTEP